MKPLLTLNIAILLLVSACGGSTATSANSPLPTGCKAASDDYSKTVLADSPVAYYRLDEIAVYSSALSPARIARHFAAA